jgi:preprotein translocase subunit SecG
MSILAEMTWGQWTLGSFLVFICFILMLVILLQKGRGGGFSGAFGGAGGSSAFGAKTGDVFTWITVVVAGVFVVLTIWGNFVFDESLRPKLAADALAQPRAIDLPLDGAPDGTQPVQPMKMELGIVDPKTGEKSTILVPSKPSTPPDGAVPTGEAGGVANLKPAEGAQPAPSPGGEPTAPAKEKPPEGEKKDEGENRPNP